MHALVLPNPKLGPKQVYFILFVKYSFLFISNLLLIRHYLPPALSLSYLSVLLAKCPQSFLQHRLGPIQVIYSLIYPDNPTDLAPAAYPIIMYILFATCLCYRAYLPIACPSIHFNFEYGPSKVYLFHYNSYGNSSLYLARCDTNCPRLMLWIIRFN